MSAPLPVEAPQRIVVTGGSGFVGQATLRRLSMAFPLAQVVVPTRGARPPTLPAAHDRADLQWVCNANVHDPDEAAQLLEGADALVHLVAILHGTPSEFERAHVQLARTWARAARDVGVRRAVHVSALGVAPDAPSLYLRSKAAGEAQWQAAAEGSGMDVTLLRPSVIFGAADRFTNLFAALLRYTPVLPVAPGGARFAPVWVEDVAAAIVALLAQPHAPGVRVVDAAGPRELTLAQIVRTVARLAGRRRAVLPLPEWAGHAQVALLRLLPGEPLMSDDNLRSMRVPNVASGGPGLASLGRKPAPLSPTASAWLREPR